MSPNEVRCGKQQQHTVDPTCRCRTCLNTFAAHDSEEDSTVFHEVASAAETTIPSVVASTTLDDTAFHPIVASAAATTIPSVVASRGLELILSSEPLSTNASDAPGTQHTHDRSPMDTSSEFNMEEPAAEKRIAFTPLDTAPSTFPM